MSKSPHIERRKAKRIPILETFSVYVVIPKKGIHRLSVNDISELGMSFDLDIEGEEPQEYPVEKGDAIDFRFYLNHTLFIPLTVKVVRVTDSQSAGRKIGAEFQERSSKSYKAFLAFLEFLDHASSSICLDNSDSNL